MGLLKDIWEFISDKKKINQVLFILPVLTFYLTNKPFWLFLVSLVILASIEVYKTDLENKIDIIKANRINQISKNKPLFRNYKDQIKDVKKEFSYLFGIPFFMIIMILFTVEFFYSMIVAYDSFKIIFAIHIFCLAYCFVLMLIVFKNFKLAAKKKK